MRSHLNYTTFSSEKLFSALASCSLEVPKETRIRFSRAQHPGLINMIFAYARRWRVEIAVKPSSHFVHPRLFIILKSSNYPSRAQRHTQCESIFHFTICSQLMIG
jgi:hypothetical protein